MILDFGFWIAQCPGRAESRHDVLRTENPKSEIRNPESHGLSIIEMLMALSISSLLLIAVTAALDASFYAYASAAESASTQSGSRLLMHRLTTMIRTTTLHDAYDPNDPTLTLAMPNLPPVQSVGIQMVDNQGQLLKIWWELNGTYTDPDLGDLWYQEDANAPQPMLTRIRIQRDGVSAVPYVFTLASRDSDDGLLMSRATIDLTVDPTADVSLSLEAYQGASVPVRLIASAVPRKTAKY